MSDAALQALMLALASDKGAPMRASAEVARRLEALGWTLTPRPVWNPIATAPRSRWVWVYAPGKYDLPPIVCQCRWHPDGGFCVDEIREPTHWMPMVAPVAPQEIIP